MVMIMNPNCEKHIHEQLRPCTVCNTDVCGKCDTYVNPITNRAISKEAWENYPRTVKLIGMEWPKISIVAHIACAKKNKMID